MANAQLIIARKDHIGAPRQDFVVEPQPASLDIVRRIPTRTVFEPPNKVIPVPAKAVFATGRQPVRFVQGTSSGQEHVYFNALVASQWHHSNYSLRSQAQLNALPVYGSYADGSHDVNYLYPNDPDARKQDAAKITLRGNGTLVQEAGVNEVSIKQARMNMPTMTPGNTYLVTWDVWHGDEWRNPNHELDQHKAFQFDGPAWQNGSAKIWWEIHQSWQGDASDPVNNATEVCATRVRYYGFPFKIDTDPTNNIPEGYYEPPAGHNFTSPHGTQPNQNGIIAPRDSFVIVPETWTRYWMLFEYQMDSATIAEYGGVTNSQYLSLNGFASPQGTLASFWMADTTRGPQQVYDRMQVSLYAPGIRRFWIEYNTSTVLSNTTGHQTLVAYIRNVVMLTGITYAQVPSILDRPVT